MKKNPPSAYQLFIQNHRLPRFVRRHKFLTLGIIYTFVAIGTNTYYYYKEQQLKTGSSSINRAETATPQQRSECQKQTEPQKPQTVTKHLPEAAAVVKPEQDPKFRDADDLIKVNA